FALAGFALAFGLGAVVALGGFGLRRFRRPLGPRGLLDLRRLLDGPALFALLLLDTLLGIDRRLRRTMVGPHHVGRFAGPRQQPLFRIAVGIALLGPRRGLLPSTFLAVLALLGLILLCLKARIGGAIGDQERGQHGRHVA